MSDLSSAQSGSKVLAYLQLFRAPNVFTAMADVSMGYLITAMSRVAIVDLGNPLRRLWPEFVLLVAASSLLYTSGMVLNDVFDFEVDRSERPQRPLPSGRIPRARAKWLGFGMLALGVALGWMSAIPFWGAHGPWWRPGIVATLLAGCILWYDGGAKQMFLGPLVMGGCRFLNVLLGMSLHANPLPGSAQLVGYGAGHLMIAGGIGIYIVGVTVFARSEATKSPRGMLALGVGIMAVGIILLAAFPTLFPDLFAYRIEPSTYWPAALLVMSIWILRRCAVAIGNPEPRYVQAAIKFCLLSLIVLDATVCLLVCPPAYAIGIVFLLVPTMILGRWVYST